MICESSVSAGYSTRAGETLVSLIVDEDPDDAHLAEHGGGKAGDNPAPEVDGELLAVPQAQPLLVGEPAERELVAELVHRELADRVGYLSAPASAHK